jgi:hypothetical protein
MSSIEAEKTRPPEEPKPSAAPDDSAKPRHNKVNQVAAWVWLALGVVLVVLILAAVFYAGYVVGTHNGTGFGGNYVAPPGRCVQTLCQPAGPHGGAQCFQHLVPCGPQGG